MLSEKAVTSEIACRFCWMCRHLCPIGLKTGKENHTPRAKALLLDAVRTGEEFSPEMAEDMYACSLCGACLVGCETGYDPRIYIREARTEAAVNGYLPEKVEGLVESLNSFGTIYGKKEGINPASKLSTENADAFLYAGATAVTKTPEIVEAVAKLLNKAGIEFIAVDNEPPCGAEMYDLIGDVNETVESAKVFVDLTNKFKIKTIVVIDPSYAKVIKEDFIQWGLDIKAEVVTATSFIAKLVKEMKLRPEKMSLQNVTYHDPCRLARDLKETEPARYLLASMGIEIKEMFLNKNMTRCCGSELVGSYSPKYAEMTSQGRWEDVERCNAKLLVTACPACYKILDKQKPDDKQIVDIFLLLGKACGI